MSLTLKQYQQQQLTTSHIHRNAIRKLIEPIMNALPDPIGEGPAWKALEHVEYLLKLSYVLHGLSGEVGEVQNMFKKVIRGDVSLKDFKKKGIIEGGDALWYDSEFSDLLGSSLEEMARLNNEKLADRANRGVIAGSGDNR